MNFDEMLSLLIQESIKQIKVTIPGEITKINTAKTKASVQPLLSAKDSNGNIVKYPIIPDVPIHLQYGGGYFVRIPFEKGDLVSVVFGAHDLKSAHKGFNTQESGGLFALSNAIIHAGLPPTSSDIPAAWETKNTLLIGSQNSYLEFSDTDVYTVISGIKYSHTKHLHPGPMTPPNAEAA